MAGQGILVHSDNNTQPQQYSSKMMHSNKKINSSSSKRRSFGTDLSNNGHGSGSVVGGGKGDDKGNNVTKSVKKASLALQSMKVPPPPPPTSTSTITATNTIATTATNNTTKSSKSRVQFQTSSLSNQRTKSSSRLSSRRIISTPGISRNLEREGVLHRTEINDATTATKTTTPLSSTSYRTPSTIMQSFTNASSSSFLSSSTSSSNPAASNATISSTKSAHSFASKSRSSLSNGNMSSSSKHSTSSSRSGRKIRTQDTEYSVQFTPGPIGMKLEPVIKSMDREIGCRVVKFVNVNATLPSQARLSKKIQVGDVISSIDGNLVLSKGYDDIISMLKTPSSNPNGKRIISFKCVQQVSHAHKSHRIVPVNTPPQQQKQPLLDVSNRSDLSTHPKSIGSASQSTKSLKTSQSIRSSSSSSLKSIRLTPSDKNVDSYICISLDNTMFSPSNVRKLTESTSYAHNTSTFHNMNMEPRELSFQKPIEDIFKIITHNVVPLAGMAISNTFSATNTVKDRLFESFVGYSKSEFEQAMRLKRELLTELSLAKAALGKEEDENQILQDTVGELQKEQLAFESEKKHREEKLSATEKAKESSWKRAEETIAQATQLAAHNSFLRSQTDLLKKQFESKEWILNERNVKTQRELDSKNKIVPSLQTELTKLKGLLEIKDEKIQESSQELTKQSTELVTARQRIEELSFREEELLGHLRMKSEKIATIESDNETKCKTIESMQLDLETKSCTIELLQSDLETKSSTIETMQSDLETKSSTIETLQSELETKSKMMETMTSELKTKSNTIESLQTDLETKLSMIESMNSSSEESALKLESMESDLEKSKIDVSNASAKAEEMETRLQDAFSNKVELEQQIQQMEKDHEIQIKKLQDEMNQVESKSKKLMEENQTISERFSNIDKQLKDKMDEMQMKTDVWKKQENLLRDELENMKKTGMVLKEHMVQEKKASEGEQKRHHENISLLESEIEKLLTVNIEQNTVKEKVLLDLKTAKAKFSETEKKFLDELQSHKQQISITEARLGKKIDSLIKEKENYQEECSKLALIIEEQKSSFNEDVQQLQISLMKAQESNEQISSAISKESQLRGILADKLHVAEQEQTKLRFELETARKHAGEAHEEHKKVEELKGRISDAENLIESMNSEAEEAKKTYDSKVEELSTVHIDQLKSLQSQLDDNQLRAQQSIDELNEVIKSNNYEIQMLNDLVAKNQKKNEDLALELESISKKGVTLNDSLKLARIDFEQKLTDTVAIYKNKLQSIQDEMDHSKCAFEGEIESLQQMLDEKLEELSNSQNLLRDSMSNLEQTKNNCIELEKRNEFLNEDAARLREENNNLRLSKQQKIDELVGQVNDFEKLIKEQNSGIKQENKEVKAQNSKLEMLLTQRETDLNALRKDLLHQTEEAERVMDSIRINNDTIINDSRKKIDHYEMRLRQMLEEKSSSEQITGENLKEAQTRILESKELAERAVQQVKDKEGIIKSLKASIASMQCEIEETNDALEKLQAKLNEMNNDKQKEIISLKDELRVALNDLKSKDSEIQTLSNKLEQTKAQSEEAENRAYEALDMVENRDKCMESITCGIQTLIEETKRLQKDIYVALSFDDKPNIQPELESVFDNETLSTSLETAELEELRVSMKAAIDSVINECRIKDNIIQHLRSSLGEQEKNSADLEKYVEKLEKEVQDLTNIQKEHENELGIAKKEGELKRLILMESVSEEISKRKELSQELEFRSKEVANLSVKLSKFEKENEDRKAKMAEIQRSVQLSELESTTLLSTIDENKVIIDELKSEIEAKNEEIEQLSQSLAESNNLLEEKNRKLDKTGEQMEDLRGAIKRYDADMTVQSQQMRSLEEEVQVQKERIIDLESKHVKQDEGYELITKELENKCRELESSLNTAHEVATNTTKACNEQKITIDQLKVELELSIVEKSQLDFKIDEMQLNVVESDGKCRRIAEEFERERQGLQSLLLEKEKQITHLSSKINSLNACSDNLQKENQRQLDQIKRYDADMTVQSQQMRSLEEEVQVQKERIIDLESKHVKQDEGYELITKELENKCRELESSLNTAHEVATNTTKACNEQKITIDQLKVELELSIVEKSQLDFKIDEMQLNVVESDGKCRRIAEEFERERQGLQSLLLEKEKQITHLSSKINSLNACSDNLQKENQRQLDQIMSFEKTMSDLSKNYELKLSNLGKEKEEIEKNLASSIEVVKNNNASIQQLQHDMEKQRKVIGELNDTCHSQEEKLSEQNNLMEEIGSKSDAINNFMTKVQEMEETISVLRSEQAEKDDQIAISKILMNTTVKDYEGKASAALNLASDRKNTIDMLTKNLEAKSTALGEVNEELRLLKESEKKSIETINELERSCDELRSSLDKMNAQEDLKLDNYHLEKQVREMEETISVLRSEQAEKDDQIATSQRVLNEKVYILQESLKESEGKATAAIDLASDRKCAYDILKKDLEAKSAALDEVSRELEVLRENERKSLATINELERSCDELRSSLNEMTLQADLNVELEFNIHKLERQVHEMKETITSLRSEQARKDSQVEAVQRVLNQKIYMLQESLKESEATANAAIDLANDRKCALDLMKEDLEAKLVMLTKVNDELRHLREKGHTSNSLLDVSEDNNEVVLNHSQAEEKESLHKSVNSLIMYEPKQITDDAYREEMSASIEEFESLRKLSAARVIFHMLDNKVCSISARAFRKWSCAVSASQAVESQMGVVEEMTNQLETTSEKLAKLKCHFSADINSTGTKLTTTNNQFLTKDRPPMVPVLVLSPMQTAMDNSFWDFSDSDAEDSQNAHES